MPVRLPPHGRELKDIVRRTAHDVKPGGVHDFYRILSERAAAIRDALHGN